MEMVRDRPAPARDGAYEDEAAAAVLGGGLEDVGDELMAHLGGEQAPCRIAAEGLELLGR